MIPMTFDSDREAIEAAIATTGVRKMREARVARIKNTLQMENLELSEAFLPETERRSDLTVVTDLREMTFNQDGYLADD
jgi:hypothetical protein